MRQYLVFTVILALFGCSTSPVSLPKITGSDISEYDQLVIVGTNDFHGYLRTIETEISGEKVIQGGAEWFAGYVDILQRKFGDRLVLLDGGDMYQGTIDSNMFLGSSVVEYYNLLPYRALAVGNHEIGRAHV